MAQPSFNLIHDPWIPVAYLDGREREVSIETVFRDADKIRCIRGDIPQQMMPMLRLLLAIMYRAYADRDGTDEGAMLDLWESLWSSRQLDQNVLLTYLEKWESRFDLFDSENPFYQVAGLEYVKKAPDGIKELIADMPKDEKYLFSSREKGRVSSLSFSEAARWLIFKQAYDVAGIKSPVKGNTHVAEGKVAPHGMGMLGYEGALCLEGKNLLETLLLNWVLFDGFRKGKPVIGCEKDLPPWENNGISCDLRPISTSEPFGPVQAFTWQSRRMRLIPSEDGSCVVGVISCYGDIPNPVNVPGSETMTAWYQTKEDIKNGSIRPERHDPSKALWRGLSSVISFTEMDKRPGVVRWVEHLCYEEIISKEELPEIAVHAQGMAYGRQDSIYIGAIDDVLDMSVALVNHDSDACHSALDAIDKIGKAVYQLARFVTDVQKANGEKQLEGKPGEKSPKKSNKKMTISPEGVHLREHAYAELDSMCRARLAHFPNDPDEIAEYCSDWKSDVYKRLLSIAKEYVGLSGRSFFAEHDSQSTGQAILSFRSSLRRALDQ